MAKEGVDGRCSIRTRFVRRCNADSLVTRKTWSAEMTHYSHDYEKVGTKANANGWNQIRKHAIEKQNARTRNPLIAERFDAVSHEIIYHRQIAADAWGYFYSMDSAPQAMRDYYQQYVDPLKPVNDMLMDMLYCRHRHTDYGDDCMVCLDCGAADYGLGWDYVTVHTHTIANIEANGQK